MSFNYLRKAPKKYHENYVQVHTIKKNCWFSPRNVWHPSKQWARPERTDFSETIEYHSYTEQFGLSCYICHSGHYVRTTGRQTWCRNKASSRRMTVGNSKFATVIAQTKNFKNRAPHCAHVLFWWQYTVKQRLRLARSKGPSTWRRK